MAYSSVPPTMPNERPRLYRSRDDKVIAGVCGGVAHRLNVDPVLLRVVTVVLVFYGGAGLLLYALGWLLLPRETEADNLLEQAFSSRRPTGASHTNSIMLAVGLILAIVLLAAGVLSSSWYALVLLVLAGAGIFALLQRERNREDLEYGPPADAPLAAERPTAPWGDPAWVQSTSIHPTYEAATPRTATATSPIAEPPAGAMPTEPATTEQPAAGSAPTEPSAGEPPTEETVPPAAASGAAAEGLTWDPEHPWAPYQQGSGWADAQHGAWEPPPPPPPVWGPPLPPPEPVQRRRSPLGKITFSLILIAMGIVWAIAAAGTNVAASVYFATALAISGAGLLVGAWFGRARGLIGLGIVTTVLLIASTFLTQLQFDPFDSGRFAVQPTSLDMLASSYEHGAGEARYDLTGIDFTGQQVDLNIKHGLGELIVELPPNVDVVADAHVGAGALRFLDTATGGVGLSRSLSDDGPDGPGGGTLRLKVDLGMGEVVINRATP